MVSNEDRIRVLRELARRYDRGGQAQVRDRFLVLAADAALAAGHGSEAEEIRAELLRLNPHHMLKPFASMAEAMRSADFRTYVEGLRRNYRGDASEPLSDEAHASDPGDLPPEPMPAEVPVHEPTGVFPMPPAARTPLPPAIVGPTQAKSSDKTQPVPVILRPATSAGPVRRQPTAPDRSPDRLATPVPFAPTPPASPLPDRTGAPKTVSQPVFSDALDHLDGERTNGRWVADGLFLLLFLAGLALLVYVFAKPFLPIR